MLVEKIGAIEVWDVGLVEGLSVDVGKSMSDGNPLEISEGTEYGTVKYPRGKVLGTTLETVDVIKLGGD